MYHISDLKKYSRCPRLYWNDVHAPKQDFQHYVRLDQTVTDLAAQKLKVTGKVFLGQTGDDPEKALDALNESDWLIKARFAYGNLRVKVPFLHRTGSGFDLYFLFIGLYPHNDDMQFYCDTVWVLEQNQIQINEIYLIHLNAEYVRGKELDVDQLFTISDSFYNSRNNPSVNAKQLIREKMQDPSACIHQMDQMDEMPEAVRTKACTGRQKCRWYEACFRKETEVPDDSILTLIAASERFNMLKEGRLYLKDADPERIEGTPQQYAQILADSNGGLFADRLALKSWLSDITFPITFLDFEWERYAIPPYEGMKPYDVLPFEYSIHLMQEDGTITHTVFLSVHDDRREMVEQLLKDIPDQGSVIAYNAEGAEKIRIAEFAELFPEYREQLLSINARMKDLQVPFAGGMVYHTGMAGTWTLKKIMSVMNDKSYNDLEIHQGMDAVFQWRHLDRNDPDVNKQEIIDELKEYCGMDSYAMTVVYKWLLKIVNENG